MTSVASTPRTDLPAGTQVPVRESSYVVVDLGAFEGNQNLIHGINNRGTMVGATVNPQSMSVEACVLEEGMTRLLGTLGGSFSIGRAINNRGQVVGGSLERQDNNFHAFLFDKGRLQDLNDLVSNCEGWELVQAVAINDLGQIVGIGSYRGEDRVFLLVPTPK